MGIYAMSMSHSGIGLLLQCPKCQAPRSLGADNGRVTCSRCHASFTKKADIIDFVAGASDTSLNVMEYDLQKRVSLDASLSLFRTLKHTSSGLIQDRLGTVLEIGAGTGLLTLGMITDSDFEH